MAFLSPLFLFGALAAAVPIVLHLLKRHPEVRVRFSAVRLLQSAPVEHSQQRHLRELLLLALRVAALLLLAFAFARPFLASNAAAASGAVVIALDTSLSLSAPGRFDQARALAQQAIARAAGPVAVVTFSDSARVAGELSGDRAIARAAVDAAQPGAGGTSYRAALAASADLLRGRTGTIVVVTDLQASGWDAGDRVSLPEAIHLEVSDVGAAPPNLAVTAARVAGDRLVATVRSTAPQAREVRVHLAAGTGQDVTAGQPAGDLTLPVGGQQSTDAAFALPQGSWASITVEDGEGARADNVRYVVLDRASRPKVLIITATGDPAHEAFYVEQALVARGANAGAYDAEGVSGNALQSWEQAKVDAYAAVVLLSTRGLDHQGRVLLGEYVKKGGGVLVAAGADVDGDVLTETLGGVKIGIAAPQENGGTANAPRALAPADVRHPVFRTFSGQSSLGLVKFRRVAIVRAEGCQTLARFTTGETALADCESGQGRALVLASDLDNKWNDFPLHATFLPFMHEVVGYLAGTTRREDYLVGSVPPGVAAVPGVISVPGRAGAPSSLAAVNVDPAESDPGRITVEAFQAAVTKIAAASDAATPPAAAREREDRQHIWQYMLALMMAVLAIESLVATRAA
jgi:hypothetical protein